MRGRKESRMERIILQDNINAGDKVPHTINGTVITFYAPDEPGIYALCKTTDDEGGEFLEWVKK